VEENDKQENS